MKLKKLRQEHSLTQEDVAKIINKTSVAYGYYEAERSEPDIQTLKKLADFYHVTIDYICEHEVPYFLDKSQLTNYQKEIIEIVKEMDDEQCRYTLAYIEGFKKAIHERDQKFKKEENI